MSAKGYRHTHCRKGHEYTPESTYTYKDGRRECGTCMKARVTRYREENRKDRREYQRIWSAGKRRAKGVPEMDNNRWRNRKAPMDENVTVPAEPFAAWVRKNLGQQTAVDFGRRYDIDESLVGKLVRGERPEIHMDTADAALTAAGEPWLLEEMYPLEEVAA